MQNRFQGPTLKDIDTNVRPQDDFYAYSVGKWLSKNPIPKTEAVWGSFYILRENSKNQLHAILQDLEKVKKVSKGSPEQLVRDLWISFMDEKRREKLGTSPLDSIFKKIDSLNAKTDFAKFLGALHKEGIGGLWGLYVGPDDKKSTENILHVYQSGISLPDRDYYTKQDTDSIRIRNAYVKHGEKMFSLVGYSKKDSVYAMQIVMQIETALAEASMTAVERRDVEAQYNKRTVGKLTIEAPFDWKTYFKAIGVSKLSSLIVAQPKFMLRGTEMITTISPEEWKVYFKWHALGEYAPFLHKAFVQEQFNFYGRVLSGKKQMQPLWKRAVSLVDGGVGDALGKLYVAKHFDKVSERKINVLVDNLFSAYRSRIQKLDWMSEGTKKKALMKLSQINRKLGHQKKWKTYSGVRITSDNLIANLDAIHRYELKRMLTKIGKAPDKAEWLMTPSTVNAYYWPNMNEIVFPAGIMQPPFFDPNAPDAINYGAIGSVIGHELTHGFDDQGKQFDGKGNFKEWWTKDDSEKFAKKAEVLVRQYDAFIAIDKTHVNGKLTLGENIADLGGVVIAFEAMQKAFVGKKREKVNGFTPEQLFFIGYAITEASHMRPESLRKQVITDPHSPSSFRVNGPLAHSEEFYEAFGVKQGDRLYRNPAERVKIW